MLSFASDPQCCPASHNFGGVDGGVENPVLTVPLHEMGISHQLLSAGALHLSSSSPQLVSWGSHHRDGSSLSNATDLIRNERGRYLRKASDSMARDSMARSEDIPLSWGKVIQSKRSSFYSSTGNSAQTQSETSRFNLSNLLASNKIKSSIQDLSGKFILNLVLNMGG